MGQQTTPALTGGGCLFFCKLRRYDEACVVELEVLNALLENLKSVEIGRSARGNDRRRRRQSTGGKIGGGGIGAQTSMLSESDLFTMMQAGTGAKRESELSELQGINEKLETLIGVTGGIE